MSAISAGNDPRETERRNSGAPCAGGRGLAGCGIEAAEPSWSRRRRGGVVTRAVTRSDGPDLVREGLPGHEPRTPERRGPRSVTAKRRQLHFAARLQTRVQANREYFELRGSRIATASALPSDMQKQQWMPFRIISLIDIN